MAKSAQSTDETELSDTMRGAETAGEESASPARPATVTVHCSLVSGLHLQLDKSVVLQVSEGGDGYKVTVPQRRIHIIAGRNPGIDANFWRAWLSENSTYSPVVSGHIFATEDP